MRRKKAFVPVPDSEWRPEWAPRKPKKYPPAKKRLTEGQMGRERRQAALGALIGAGVDKKQALEMTGYKSESVLASPVVRETVAQMRERLQGSVGTTLEDSVEFYKGISEDADNRVDDRLKARSRLDKVLDFDAAKRVEVNETRELNMAVSWLANLPVEPREILRILSDDSIEDGDFKPAE
ncbi:MAG: hypothetical protein LBU70_05235 [Chitinispirillales bacterium]|nr:hypothetical protein [Chitinispirillales bacterium]